jgi:hypothetical protein
MLLLSLGATPLLAAEAPAAAAPKAAPPAAAKPAKTQAEQDAAVAEEIRKAEAEAASKPKAGNNETFVPSEKISEDLSVSFPVDI